MAGSEAPFHIADPRSLVDYAASLDCIHCGLCLTTCPTYRLTGVESSSPRGRIHLMRAVAEGRLAPDREYAEELDFCLVCRHCESVCPAGVRFGHMLEWARDGIAAHVPRSRLARAVRRFAFARLLTSRRWLRLAASLLRALQVSGLARLGRPFGARGAGLAFLPRVPPARERRPLPAVTPARGARRDTAAVLEGCAMPELLPGVNRATVASLAALGVECRTAPGHVCCGALHAHNGELELARALARETIRRFDALTGEAGTPLPVVVNSAGCGAHMKEYAELLHGDAAWRERAAAFAERVLDYSELASRHVAGQRLALALGRVTWDDPCHLCHGQGVREEPRALLDAVEGLERVELEDSESCCGSAGLYSLLRPADSAAVLAPRLAALAASGARVLVTANPGCQLQWQAGIAQRGLDVRVRHLAEVLAEALGA